VERLQKYLASCGVDSRRGAEKLIEAGRITVNGEVATLGCKIDPASDTVLFDGATVGKEDFLYILLNKPEGLVTTVKDTHDRETVMDCLTGVSARVYPVGRLDMDVGGVLLLTNDGELANRLIHPSFKVSKVYLAWVWGHVNQDAVANLCKGVELEDGMTAPAKVRIVERSKKQTCLRIEIYEGKKREVKRMCIAVGHRVASLTRLVFCGLQVRDLAPGEWRHLEDSEVADLRKATIRRG
jgi:23S rRNA pseudouridine2605 synthase